MKNEQAENYKENTQLNTQITIRAQVTGKVASEVGEASCRQHEHGVSTLYVASDGEVFWDLQPSANTWLQRADGTLHGLYQAGTGSVACNCDACVAGDSPRDWAHKDDGIASLADELGHSVAAIPAGFFDDEADKKTGEK